MIGSNEAALALMESLRQSGLWVPAIRPPTVPVGTARLRIALSAAHTADDVDQLLQALTDTPRSAQRQHRPENLFKVLLEIALECNRNEWMLRMRRMGSCPCKQPGRPIARFHSNPSGKCLAGRSAALRRLPIAGLLAAHRA